MLRVTSNRYLLGFEFLEADRYKQAMEILVPPKPREGANTRMIAGVLVSIGILIRIAVFLRFRPLWIDESMLANNIVSRHALQLLQPLDNAQGAPILFLLLERLSWILLHHDWALRLVPLFSGCFSLIVLMMIARRFLESWGLVALAALAAFCVPWIYYSSEVKQYSTDMAVGLVMLLLAVQWGEQRSTKRLILLTVAGAIGLWLSHAALFIAAAIGTALLLDILWLRSYHKLIRGVITTGAVWVVNFCLVYLISLRQLSSNSWLRDYWVEGFIPLGPGIIRWLRIQSLNVFRSPCGIIRANLALAISVLGTVDLLRRPRSRALGTALILFPILVALLGSAVHVYPFMGRLILYLLPLLLLLIARGLGRLMEIPAIETKLMAVGAFFLLFGYLPYDSFTVYEGADQNRWHSLTDYAIPPYEDMRSVTNQMQMQAAAGDLVFRAVGAAPAYDFYAMGTPLARLQLFRLKIGDPTANLTWQEIEPVINAHKRIWVVFSHADPAKPTPEYYFKEELDQHPDAIVQRFLAHGASAYLIHSGDTKQ